MTEARPVDAPMPLTYKASSARLGLFDTGIENPDCGFVSRHGVRHSIQKVGMTEEAREPASRIEKLCAEHGLRMTAPRRVIARVLSDASDHPDVDEVYRRVHAVDPRISLSTVYRTVGLLTRKGIIARHDFGAGRMRFEEASSEHHDHLINVETGDVIEFHNEEIEQLQERVAKELGFELVGHRLQLFGVPIKRRRDR
jgi:Fur family ferric uptake transcriptional regulator